MSGCVVEGVQALSEGGSGVAVVPLPSPLRRRLRRGTPRPHMLGPQPHAGLPVAAGPCLVRTAVPCQEECRRPAQRRVVRKVTRSAVPRRRGSWGQPICRSPSFVCKPLTMSRARGSTPGVARRRATTEARPLTAATCRGVLRYCRGHCDGQNGTPSQVELGSEPV